MRPAACHLSPLDSRGRAVTSRQCFGLARTPRRLNFCSFHTVAVLLLILHRTYDLLTSCVGDYNVFVLLLQS